MSSVVDAGAGAATAALGPLAEPARFERVALECSLSPLAVLRAVRGQPGAFALTGSWAGGGAIVGCRPLLRAPADGDPFAILATLPRLELGDEVPAGAVGGGWFGWLGYRLGRRIERLPAGPARPVALPEFSLAYYDHVLRLDPEGRWWFEALVSDRRWRELDERREALVATLAAGPPRRVPYEPPPPLRLSSDAALHHLAAIRECRERIAAGEIYQANICLRLEAEWEGDVAALFERARERIDPPYAAVFCTPAGGIASLSPELFLRRQGSQVSTAPIKGTIRRDPDRARAQPALEALRASAKDAAEHVMIVDLMRNDLGRVCEYGSVQAPRRPHAEAHPGLWHLVSRVRGSVRAGADDGDLLRATFPPGSVTGAPKVQAMRVIAELEPTGREVYTGAIGYASPVAGLELNVAIRTLELSDGRLWLGAGGGIVADSDPRRELDEALLKARPIAAAIGSSVSADDSAADHHPPDSDRGVFETMLVRGGTVQALDRHLERLAGAVSGLYGERLPAGEVRDRIAAATAPTSEAHRLRVSAVPRPGADVVVRIELEPLELPDPGMPLALAPMLLPGGLGAYKWCDRRLLERSAEPGSVALIVDRGGEVLEAAWANVWIVEGGRIVTPPADGRLLPGVTRARLLELAPALGLAVDVQALSLARLRAADVIFLTSSLRHAVPAALTADVSRCPGDRQVASPGDPDARRRGLEVVAGARAALAQA